MTDAVPVCIRDGDTQLRVALRAAPSRALQLAGSKRHRCLDVCKPGWLRTGERATITSLCVRTAALAGPCTLQCADAPGSSAAIKATTARCATCAKIWPACKQARKERKRSLHNRCMSAPLWLTRSCSSMSGHAAAARPRRASRDPPCVTRSRCQATRSACSVGAIPGGFCERRQQNARSSCCEHRACKSLT